MQHEHVSAALTAAPQPYRTGFTDAVDRLRSAIGSGDELVGWARPRGLRARLRGDRYPVYADAAIEVFMRLLDLVEASGLDDLWLDELPQTSEETARLPMGDAAAFIVTIWHGERISENLIGACIDSGLLMAAAERVAADL
jgi:hypothetical protein